MTSEPFIECPILDNADEIDEFIQDYGFDESDMLIFLERDIEFGGWFASFCRLSDEETLAVTSTWENKSKLKDFLRQTIGYDYSIEEKE